MINKNEQSEREENVRKNTSLLNLLSRFKHGIDVYPRIPTHLSRQFNRERKCVTELWEGSSYDDIQTPINFRFYVDYKIPWFYDNLTTNQRYRNNVLKMSAVPTGIALNLRARTLPLDYSSNVWMGINKDGKMELEVSPFRECAEWKESCPDHPEPILAGRYNNILEQISKERDAVKTIDRSIWIYSDYHNHLLAEKIRKTLRK